MHRFVALQRHAGGVDVQRADALGYLQLTDAGDTAVLNHCLGRDTPVAGLMNRAALARRHGILHHSAARVWGEHGLGRLSAAKPNG